MRRHGRLLLGQSSSAPAPNHWCESEHLYSANRGRPVLAPRTWLRRTCSPTGHISCSATTLPDRPSWPNSQRAERAPPAHSCKHGGLGQLAPYSCSARRRRSRQKRRVRAPHGGCWWRSGCVLGLVRPPRRQGAQHRGRCVAGSCTIRRGHPRGHGRHLEAGPEVRSRTGIGAGLGRDRGSSAGGRPGAFVTGRSKP